MPRVDDSLTGDALGRGPPTRGIAKTERYGGKGIACLLQEGLGRSTGQRPCAAGGNRRCFFRVVDLFFATGVCRQRLRIVFARTTRRLLPMPPHSWQLSWSRSCPVPTCPPRARGRPSLSRSRLKYKLRPSPAPPGEESREGADQERKVKSGSLEFNIGDIAQHFPHNRVGT